METWDTCGNPHYLTAPLPGPHTDEAITTSTYAARPGERGGGHCSERQPAAGVGSCRPGAGQVVSRRCYPASYGDGRCRDLGGVAGCAAVCPSAQGSGRWSSDHQRTGTVTEASRPAFGHRRRVWEKIWLFCLIGGSSKGNIGFPTRYLQIFCVASQNT